MIIDDNYLIVSEQREILIYPPGQTSPSSTFKGRFPDRPALNKAENEIYVPKASYNRVGVYGYSSGTFVTNIPIGAFASGAALSPAPTH